MNAITTPRPLVPMSMLVNLFCFATAAYHVVLFSFIKTDSWHRCMSTVPSRDSCRRNVCRIQHEDCEAGLSEIPGYASNYRLKLLEINLNELVLIFRSLISKFLHIQLKSLERFFYVPQRASKVFFVSNGFGGVVICLYLALVLFWNCMLM